jgi:hypothetical protein
LKTPYILALTIGDYCMETRGKNFTYLSKSYKPATVTELPERNYPDFVLVVGETIDDPEGGGCWYKSTLPPKELKRIEETNQVVEFLDHSYEFKKLLEIYYSHQSHKIYDVAHIIENIRKAYTFTKILEALDRFDPEKNAAYPAQAKIANSIYMTYCFFRGFVDDYANVAYYASDLRKNTIDKMVKLGYMKNNLSFSSFSQR